MDAVTTSKRQHHSRIPAPTMEDPAKTVWCQGTVHRGVYTPDGWFVESCDGCMYWRAGFVEVAGE